jgi:hypothetical protein
MNDTVDIFLTVDWGWIAANSESPLLPLIEPLLSHIINKGGPTLTSNAITHRVNDTINRKPLQDLSNALQYYHFNVPSKYTIMHNVSSPHGIAIFHTTMTDSWFRSCTSSTSGSHLLYAKNHPLAANAEDSIRDRVILSILTSIFLLIPLCYIPSAYSSFLVLDRISKTKHLIHLSGVSRSIYWLSIFLWDYLNYLIQIILVIVALFLIGRSNAVVFIGSPYSVLSVIGLLICYGLSAIPLCYVYSKLFIIPSTAAVVIITAINFATGFGFVLAYFVMISLPSTVYCCIIGTACCMVFSYFSTIQCR